jgi:hypothetical protein
MNFRNYYNFSDALSETYKMHYQDADLLIDKPKKIQKEKFGKGKEITRKTCRG